MYIAQNNLNQRKFFNAKSFINFVYSLFDDGSNLFRCTYSMKTIVLGPPGTGKTETLLREVEKYLKTTDPNRIGYFSFTQKAANEGRDRAIDKFN